MNRWLIWILIPAGLWGQIDPSFKPGLEHPVDGAMRGVKKMIPLQPLLDSLKPGDTLKLEKGMYYGPAFVRTPRVVIDGQGVATLNGRGIRSVLYIEADSVTVQNLHIINSNDSPDKIDSGIKLKKVNGFKIYNNKIEETLFGIDVFWSKNGEILHNEITSMKRKPKGLKGDGIRLWYSENINVQENYWHHVRDMVVWYSQKNKFVGNLGDGNRYSIHFMYSHNNRISHNHFKNSSVGVFLMYSEQTIMNNNLVENSQGVTGMGLGMKETSSNQIIDNKFIYSARGIYIDVSPFVPWKTNTITGNEIAYCNTAIEFLRDQEGNLFRHNMFHDNLQQVFVQGGGGANRNKWIENYWDDYAGFDRDGDNIGDFPHRIYEYHARLWRFNPNVKFFYGSPILSVLDYLEKLAPFSEPQFILKDPRPIFSLKEFKKQRQKQLNNGRKTDND
ncbi:MAG: nitrous oxide reductase family maturation protein NosD [Chlorobi bacterium]|nr:nitrous oxide reductase family maturation protein NosD [Chlorobiota bacterium]